MPLELANSFEGICNPRLLSLRIANPPERMVTGFLVMNNAEALFLAVM